MSLWDSKSPLFVSSKLQIPTPKPLPQGMQGVLACRNVVLFQRRTVLLASTRSPRTGMIQIYSWRFPFLDFQELSPCRYHVPLHESEDMESRPQFSSLVLEVMRI
jgi:hypothetical protein